MAKVLENNKEDIFTLYDITISYNFMNISE